jgi:hypothetical protein
MLRLLGASEAAALSFALVEATALGALTGLVGALLALVLTHVFGLAGLPLVTGGPAGLLVVWLVAAGLACALAGALSFRSTRSDARLASIDQA